MRDAIVTEGAGVPTVLVVIGWLSSIAEETRHVAGLRELAIVPITQSFLGLSRAEIADEAAKNCAPVDAGLTLRANQP